MQYWQWQYWCWQYRGSHWLVGLLKSIDGNTDNGNDNTNADTILSVTILTMAMIILKTLMMTILAGCPTWIWQYKSWLSNSWFHLNLLTVQYCQWKIPTFWFSLVKKITIHIWVQSRKDNVKLYTLVCWVLGTPPGMYPCVFILQEAVNLLFSRQRGGEMAQIRSGGARYKTASNLI